MAKAYIGTSGFSYPHWGNGVFYPKDLPQSRWFEYYCRYFNSVELNVSFYRLPKKEVFVSWHERAGKDFVFSLKGSRFITHVKKIKDCQEAVERFFETIIPLRGLTSREVRPHREKHVILWQLPPSLVFDELRLKNFLDLLPQTFRHAFEFRHESWIDEQTWKILKKYNAAVVFQDWPDWPMIREVTADFVYLRFHGNRELYSSEYTDKELKAWAGDIREWLKQGEDIYAYFNNDALGFAVPNAKRLQEVASQDLVLRG